MDLVHLHLLLNHIPVIGMGFAFLVLMAGAFRKSNELVKTALVVIIVLAVIAIPTYLTGDPAGDTLAKLPGISKAAIERHDDAAERALTGMEILGGISLLGLFLFRHAYRIPRWFVGLALLGAIAVCGLMAYAANLGGQIRHTEIAGRTSPVAPAHAERD